MGDTGRLLGNLKCYLRVFLLPTPHPHLTLSIE